jgi:hypothetical protein
MCFFGKRLRADPNTFWLYFLERVVGERMPIMYFDARGERFRERRALEIHHGLTPSRGDGEGEAGRVEPRIVMLQNLQ